MSSALAARHDPSADAIVGQMEYRVLTAAEERDLFRRMHAGDEGARELLVKHNMRLVVHVAKGYRGRGLPFSDVIQEGTIGLLVALDKFDLGAGTKFSTYAHWWIMHYCQRAPVNQGTTVRLPLHVVHRRVQADKYRKNNPGCSDEDVARAAGCSVEQLKEAEDAKDWAVSLDERVADDGSSMLELVPDLDAEDPEDVPWAIGHDVEGALSSLSPSEERVLRLRFGYEGAVMSFAEVAGELGISETRAQTLQRAALDKLRKALAAE